MLEVVDVWMWRICGGIRIIEVDELNMWRNHGRVGLSAGEKLQRQRKYVDEKKYVGVGTLEMEKLWRGGNSGDGKIMEVWEL